MTWEPPERRYRFRPLLHDVQRDMTFYRLTVEFRNAVEAMQARHGRLDDPDHRFWGLPGGDPPWRPPQSHDDDGLAPSGVPKRPRDGAGGAAAAVDPPR
jgi:hypothetical protein